MFSTTQTALPVIIRETGRLVGYYYLAGDTVIDESMTTLATLNYNVSIERRGGFFAHVVPMSPDQNWVNNDFVPFEVGYEQWIGIPGIGRLGSPGGGVEPLRAAFNGGFPAKLGIQIPSDAPNSLHWTAKTYLGQVHQYGFFQFNWLEIFKAVGFTIPGSIRAVTVPSGFAVEFIDVVAFPSPVPGIPVELPTTCKIVVQHQAVAGTFNFSFEIDQADRTIPTTVDLSLVIELDSSHLSGGSMPVFDQYVQHTP